MSFRQIHKHWDVTNLPNVINTVHKSRNHLFLLHIDFFVGYTKLPKLPTDRTTYGRLLAEIQEMLFF